MFHSMAAMVNEANMSKNFCKLRGKKYLKNYTVGKMTKNAFCRLNIQNGNHFDPLRHPIAYKIVNGL